MYQCALLKCSVIYIFRKLVRSVCAHLTSINSLIYACFIEFKFIHFIYKISKQAFQYIHKTNAIDLLIEKFDLKNRNLYSI